VLDRHSVVNVGVLEWSAEDCGFDLQLGQTDDGDNSAGFCSLSLILSYDECMTVVQHIGYYFIHEIIMLIALYLTNTVNSVS
jgi:hypothetical protein